MEPACKFEVWGVEFVNKKSYLGHPPKSVSLGVFWGSHPPTKKEAGSEVCVEGGGGLIDGSQPKQKHQEEKVCQES